MKNRKGNRTLGAIHLGVRIMIIETRMKTKKTKLDVDFIGGQGSLTVAEEKALSDFLKNRQTNIKKTISSKLKSVKRIKVKV